MITVQKYTSAMKKKWEDFVWKSNNGTIFNTRKFLSYHQEGKFTDHSLCFLSKGKLTALLPAAEISDSKKTKFLVSHPGASYGGIITGKDTGIQASLKIVDAFLEYVRKNSFKKVIITQPPVIYSTYINNYIDFALMSKGFHYMKRELTSVLSLGFEEGTTYNSALKRCIKKAVSSGVTIIENRDFENYYDILKHNLKMRHNVTPTHTLQELFLLNKMFPEEVRLFAAYYKMRMVGGVVLFVCNERLTLAFYISHSEKYQEYRIVDYLLSEVINWSRNNGFRYIDFGTFTLNMEPNFGLGKFKEKFGARGIFRDTLFLDLDE